MILNTPENRAVVTDYLKRIDEDTFINEIIIPLFSSHGYYLYRKNLHGQGEHGKDLIFYKSIPIFYDNEYLVIQAKSEKLTTANVEKFSSQIKRALKIPFTPKSGGGDLHAHYAVFINSKKHTSEAADEFQKLIREIPHIKILSQENVCELIMKTGIGPDKLLKQLSTNTPETQSRENTLIYEVIMSNKPAEIDNLLEHKMKFMREEISSRTKELIIDYIYDRWQMDRSWSGTVKPMKWFDTYFDFFTEKHSKYFLTIFDELMSSSPSFEAMRYTRSIVRKITPELLSHIENDFVRYCAERVRSYPRDNIIYLINKLKELAETDMIKDSKLKKIAHKIILMEDSRDEPSSDTYKQADAAICKYLYPDDIRRR